MIGRLGRPHGVGGALHARPTGPTLAALAPGAELSAAPVDGPERRLVLQARAGTETSPILRFAGVATRADATALAGALLLAPAERLPALADPDSHYVRDLIGFTAQAGERSLGAVRDVHSGPANDTLVIDGPAGELLVPFTADAIVTLDRAARRLAVRPDLFGDA